MQRTIESTFRIAAGMSLALLAACGGGGGGGGATGFPSVPAAPQAEAPDNDATQNPVTPETPSAVPGAEERAAFELLNNERLTCGFGALARNSQLDEAARGHANWLLLNNFTGHYQQEGTTAFTGVNPADRIKAAGYVPAWSADEIAQISGSANTTGYGMLAVRGLLSAPYHLVGMVSATRDVGIAVMSSDEAGSTEKFKGRIVAQFDLAYTAASGSQTRPADTVLSYPCAGTNGTFARLSGESPNPLPGRNLGVSPVGQPVYLVGDANKTLAISSTLMQETGTGNTVALLAPITSATDANKTLKVNEAIVFPDAPLKTNTEYAVTIDGTNGGTSFTKTFKFKTGALAEATSAPR